MPYVVFNPALCSWVGGKLFLCCCTFIPVTVYGCNGKMLFGIPSLSPLTDCYFYTSANGECSRVHLMVFLHNSPLTD